MDQITIKENSEILEVTSYPPYGPRLLQVKSEFLPKETYIVESPSALRILLQPWIVAGKLAKFARESSIDFLRAAYHLIPELRESNFENISEVVPLAGALYYGVAEAFQDVFGETINRCFVGAKRHLTPSGWVTDLSYLNFEALSSESVILIGDTIATGGTINSIIDSTLEKSKDVRAVIIYAIAGGVLGSHRIKKIEEQTQVPIYCFFSNAIFGVENNGTDMPWLHPGTIVTSDNRKKALAAYGPDLGKQWCSIWDWGERAKYPMKHLKELSERCESELSKTTESSTKQILQRIRTETQKAIERRKRALSI
jgi:hypothetical protein